MELDELLAWSGAALALGVLLAAAAIGGSYMFWWHCVRTGIERGQPAEGRAMVFGVEGLLAALMLLVEFVFAASLFVLHILGAVIGNYELGTDRHPLSVSPSTILRPLQTR